MFFFWQIKNIFYFCSNFFVFQSCELRFSGIFYRFPIRSFPGSFVFGLISGGVFAAIYKKIKNVNKKKWQNRIIFKMWGGVSLWVCQKLKRPRKSRFQIVMKLLSKAQLQIFSSKKVRVFCWSSQIYQDWTFLTNLSSDHWISSGGSDFVSKFRNTVTFLYLLVVPPGMLRITNSHKRPRKWTN